jgi:flagellar biosynthesis chaperone FliJ
MYQPGQARWTKWGGFSRKVRREPTRLGAYEYGEGMDSERDQAVDAHLTALDDEITRLRQMEAALDRRIEEAEEERRAIEESTRRHAAPPAGEDSG